MTISPHVTATERQMFLNHYTCFRCGEHWTDVWGCQVDDECPHCGARHCSPVESEDLVVADDRSWTQPLRITKDCDMKNVLVIVSGGVVQNVVCPDGITVVVRDFDVEGVEEEAIKTEGDERFIESVWSAQ
uniref:Uncharacterized protein n=2 Tax=Rubinisphaera brasiliensis TaxID=119 RepID=F0SJ26_RUBBR|nr:hypothetical protein Plabr_0947 [Rubinisphaera brasiliensis DSM 5305]